MTPWADILEGLVRTVIYGAPLVAVTYAVTRFVPAVPARVRVLAWWLVTARLILWLVALPTIGVPILPAPSATDAPAVAGGVPFAGRSTPSAQTPRSLAMASGTAPSRSAIVLASWVSGLLVLGAVAIRRSYRLRTLARAASAAGSDVVRRADAVAANVGLRTPFDVRVTPEIRTPQVVGLLRPVVLLPRERLASLDALDLDMVLCHELLHIRHRDLWFGMVPAAARWLLFFNPLAHLAAREYVLAREAACDARVLELLDIAPRRYGALLLSFASGPAAAGGAAATGSFTTLSRRLMMLDRTPRRRPHRAAFAAPACAVFALLPFSPVARAVVPDAPVDTALSQPASLPSTAVARHSDPSREHVSSPDMMHVSDDDRTAWVLFKEGDDSVHMNGNTNDVAAARAARRGREALLYLRRDGREYVVRDAATIDRVRKAFEPVEALGRQQADVGAKQAAIGAKQAEVGQKQAEIGARQAAIGTKQAAIGARQAAAANLSSDAAREAQLKDLESQMETLGQQMEALGRDMEELSKPMEDLSKEMEPLSKEQERLGAQMESLVEHANADMERIVDDAIAKGVATPVR